MNLKHISFIGEVVVTLALVSILIAFLYIEPLIMPMTVEMIVIVGIVILFLILIALIWKEKAQDERESQHRSQAGRISFFVGSSILVIGVISQIRTHEIDPWLIYTLVGMVLAKVMSRMYSQMRE